MDMFSALAEPARRDIIELLSQKGELPATDIYDKFSISHPAVSQHLQILHEAKLVSVEKLAQQRIYRLNPKTISELGRWAKHTIEVWEERFDALDKVLEEEKKKTHNKKR
jgi:DNA-binding transcriptional ArsR family regulator